MNISNKIKLEKYIPVRKQHKAINKEDICQKQSISSVESGANNALPEAA